jgi:two-component system sensor histidine kinase/response regulator
MSGSADPHASVLIVDDTIENLRLLSNLLGEHGYEVRAVTNGRQALQAVEHDPPDLILLDITMPEMDGYEVCRRLRARDGSREVPVIFLTALTDASDKVLAFEAGGVDYVTKPFQFEEVLARVRAHVALSRARSELTQSYQRLRALEELRDNLVHMVVHDMKSPLTAILLHLGLLKRPVAALAENTQEILRTAVSATEMLSQMVNDLLDVSRLEEGKMPVERAIWDLTRMAGEVRETLAAMDRGRRIDVETNEAVPVSCDGAIIRRTLENLLGNAIKHTPAGTPVRISIARRTGRVRVEVHDEGDGVPPEAREKIFEKFATVLGRHERSYHSAGLGLTFCKLAVEAHDGTIGVDARAPAGSTFWFELPG